MVVCGASGEFAIPAATHRCFGMLPTARGGILGKIAAGVEHAVAERAVRGAPAGARGTTLAAGNGWRVADVICTSGPADRPFEEEHSLMSVGIVLAGTFQYRSATGDDMLTPGAFLLGNAGQCFECGHEHATGDRCVAFQYEPEFFERLAADVGARGFRSSRIPPTRGSSALVARVSGALVGEIDASWEELAIDAAATALSLSCDTSKRAARPSRTAMARVTDGVRHIERDPTAPLTLDRLARDAGQSAFHYLRTFRSVTGVTPHQFVLRARLRHAAARLVAEESRVLQIALDAGFGDLSNFNRAFRAEFGATPREYRKRHGGPVSR